MKQFLAQWMPIDASAHGHQVDDLIVLTHWLMLVLFVVWGAYFLFVLYRFNAKRHPHADHLGARTHVSTYGELGVAVVEVILLVGLSIPAWYRWTHLPQKENNPFEVRVVAEQFAWNVQYPGPDGVFGRTDPALMSSTNPLGIDPKDPNAKDDIVTLNQLHLPLNRPAVVHITSKDVIHSFKLPVMRSEQDAIPGMDVPIHFTPILSNDNGDRWEIACAQLCGLGHYRMRGQLFVHGPAEFAKWMKSAPTAFSTQ
jgi:cytochrome c oxidase subunit 2